MLFSQYRHCVVGNPQLHSTVLTAGGETGKQASLLCGSDEIMTIQGSKQKLTSMLYLHANTRIPTHSFCTMHVQLGVYFVRKESTRFVFHTLPRQQIAAVGNGLAVSRQESQSKDSSVRSHIANAGSRRPLPIRASTGCSRHCTRIPQNMRQPRHALLAVKSMWIYHVCLFIHQPGHGLGAYPGRRRTAQMC